MSSYYDLVVIGGGVAGSSLARCMAKAGASVLVLETESEFRDRAFGEVLCPWGVVEAQSLGLLDVFHEAGALEVGWCNQYLGSQQVARRDFRATTPGNTPLMTFHSPRLRTCLLNAAQAAGAVVHRGVIASSVLPGRHPQVEYQLSDVREEEVNTRLVVVADGRESRFRRLPGMVLREEEHTLCVAGVLLDSVPLPQDTFHMFMNPALGEMILWAPEGESRVRAHLCYWGETRPRFQGEADLDRLLHALEWTGLAKQYLAHATIASPLVTMDGADVWIDQPCANGVVLLGDAAASSDPSWGQGLSLAFRGVRILRDALLTSARWDQAGQQYAREQASFYGNTRTVAGWFRELFLRQGASADAVRARELPLIADDPMRVPDVLFSGPDIPISADAQARFFGDDMSTKATA